jgi:hypothetical protein
MVLRAGFKKNCDFTLNYRFMIKIDEKLLVRNVLSWLRYCEKLICLNFNPYTTHFRSVCTLSQQMHCASFNSPTGSTRPSMYILPSGLSTCINTFAASYLNTQG